METTVRVSRRMKRLLLRADGLIGKYGWIRGKMGNTEVGFCLVGAVREAAGPGWWSRFSLSTPRGARRALRALRSCITGYGSYVSDQRALTTWNDANCNGSRRTEAEVRGLLQSVARGRCPE